jgi:transposase
MPMVAELVDAVVGGDTHRDTHTLEMVTPVGATIATLTIDNDEAGFAAVVVWIAEHAPGPRIVVGLEGTRSFGIGLARALAAGGFTVVEVERSLRVKRRRGKSDPIDARRAAEHVLRMDAERMPTPRADGDREALRILVSARAEIAVTKTRQICRLKALLLAGDDTDRDLARGALTIARLRTIARRRGNGEDTVEQAVRRAEARRLAIAIRDAERELAANHKQLTALVHAFAPGLLDRHGVGPVTAAQAILSWSHRGRCRTEAAFAAFAGAAPIPASSGRTVRHRLHRGGDRQLNKALYVIAITRAASCPRTRDYIARRRAEGKTDGEIRRMLKRYIARELYRALNATATA